MTVDDNETDPDFPSGRTELTVLDIVGIGALNLDYVAEMPAAGRRSEGGWNDLFPEFAWGGETAVAGDVIHRVVEWVNAASVSVSLGGSAFNAIFALARMKLDLRLGYVGLAGRIPLPGLSAVQQLRSFGVDARCVESTGEALSGVCFSLLDGEKRTLLTHAGANSMMGEHIEHRFDELLDYLATARIVHVTSFLDQATPGPLLRLLTALRERRPSVILSFDPGHVWCAERSPKTLGMLALSDFVLLNHTELRLLSRAATGETDLAAAERILAGMDQVRATVIVKHAEGIASYAKGTDGESVLDFYSQRPLPVEAIQDSTGAGDVFAGGLLAVLASHRLQNELGALLGMTLARHKLRYVGSHGHADFAELTRAFISTCDAERRAVAGPAGVFIAHGGDPHWLVVKDFLRQEFAVPVHSFESGVWGSMQVSQALGNYLDICGWAVCVLTAEDLAADGRRHARQNVIHEVGLFQGRYGPDRVIVLVEEGCEFFPDISRRPPIVFRRNHLSAALWPLEEELLELGMRRQQPEARRSDHT